MFHLSETHGPTQFWERRIRCSFCQKLRGQPSSEKGGFVVPSVRNSGANPVLGKEDSLFLLSGTQGPTQFWERRIRCSFCQKLRGQHSCGKGGFVVPFCQKLRGQPSSSKGGFVVPFCQKLRGQHNSRKGGVVVPFCQKLRGQPISGKGGFVVPSVRNSGANPILGKEETQGPTQFWERRIRCSFC